MPKKYIRTDSGDFWEWDKDEECYRRPGLGNVVFENANYIVAQSDNILDLVRPGDLVIFESGSGRVIEDKDIMDCTGCIPSVFKIKQIFVPSAYRDMYMSAAFNHNGLWILK